MSPRQSTPLSGMNASFEWSQLFDCVTPATLRGIQCVMHSTIPTEAVGGPHEHQGGAVILMAPVPRLTPVVVQAPNVPGVCGGRAHIWPWHSIACRDKPPPTTLVTPGPPKQRAWGGGVSAAWQRTAPHLAATSDSTPRPCSMGLWWWRRCPQGSCYPSQTW